MLVDSHVNLHGERYAEDLAEVLDRARAAGVSAMLAISDRLDATEEIAAIVAQNQPAMWRTVGVHPHHAKDYADLTAAQLIGLAQPAEVIGIGECGLDFHYEYSDRAVQHAVFDAHVAAARATGLPLVIHTRNADAEMATALETAYETGPFKILLHCYTGGMDLAQRALRLGAYVAFSGILTFKKAEEVREVAEAIPLERVLVETDCPFLAPVPMRGRRNEPAFLPHVVSKLAEVKGVSLETMARATTDAFYTLFDRAAPPS